MFWPGPAQGYHGAGPSRFCGKGHMGSLPSRFCGALPSRFLWWSAQCSPSVALVQLGGVLALHVHHVVLRGLLPIVKEQLLGLPITLTFSA